MNDPLRPTEPPVTYDDGDGGYGVPPLPADEVGGQDPYTLGYRSGLAESSGYGVEPAEGYGIEPAEEGGPMMDNPVAPRFTATGPAAGRHAGPGEFPAAGERFGIAVDALGAKVEGRIQAMTSWFAGRTAAEAQQQGFRPMPGSLPGGAVGPGTGSQPLSPRLPGYGGGATSGGWQTRPAGPPGRGPGAARRDKRQAHLTLARVEPWSVMKFSFVASLVAFVILFVAVIVLYGLLSGIGVFSSLQHTVSSITSGQNGGGTNISNWFSASRVLGYTAMLGALNIVLITALSTIGAVIYNLIAHVFDGIEITLRETD